MTLSVGFGRIVNDPEATILTRKALGRLATPGLLVTDRGLTIDTNGRMVLRISSGLSEDSNGLSVKVKAGGGLVSDDDGLALDDPLGDITVTNITVNQNANITGDVNVAGDINSIGAVTAPVINSGTITNTGDISSGTATITGNASVGGTLTVAAMSLTTLTVSGNAGIGGLLTTGSLAVTGNAGIAGSLGAGSAAISGALTAGSAGISGAASVGGVLSAASAAISGALTAASAAISGALSAASATISGAISAASASISGNVNAATGTIGDNQLTALGLISGAIEADTLYSLGTIVANGNCSVAAFGCDSIDVNGGTSLTKILSYTGTLNFPFSAGGFQIVSVSFTLSGALYDDLLVCSPISTGYGSGFGSWSAAMTSNGNALIRVVINSTFASSVNVTFRLTAFRFA